MVVKRRDSQLDVNHVLLSLRLLIPRLSPLSHLSQPVAWPRHHIRITMRVRIKGPSGTAALSLTDDATIGDLISQIAEKTSISSFDVKYGFPPKPLLLEEKSKQLINLGVKLDGESLTVIPKEEPAASTDVSSDKQSTNDPLLTRTKGIAPAPSVSFTGMNSSNSIQPNKPVSLQKKAMAGEVPEIPLPERGATLGIALKSFVEDSY